MRAIYSLLLYLAVPLVLLRLWWKGRRQPEYRARIGERFGCVPRTARGVAVWVHAVSVGETLAAVPLVERLIERFGAGNVWFTTTTPTGSARALTAFGARVRHAYAPYDLPDAVARFLTRVQPRAIVVMETELWPNLFRAAAARGIPLVIANARLSPRSWRGYSRLRKFFAGVLADCTHVAAQSSADAQRFRQLGAPRVSVVGNLKFDLKVPQEQLERGCAFRARLGPDRPTWIAASTHEGEEALVLAVHRQILQTLPNALLLLVPRHPQRFQEVARLIDKTGLPFVRRSELSLAGPAAAVFLGDSMGEMYAYLAAADLAFVGGSLVPVGGHNVLEPAALALPVLFGPHMHNFQAARELLLEAGAALEIADQAALARQTLSLLGDRVRRARMGQAGHAAVEANRGALERLLALIETLPQAR
jgi:3-deoxy-D-manno-octulosonic-acid transferase